jgi:hypothetical protein
MARGGFRQGAGRPSGSTNKSSPEQSQRLSELAKAYTEETQSKRSLMSPETVVQMPLESQPLTPYSTEPMENLQ